MGMGRCEIHAETVADGETIYLGRRDLEKNYDLYAVLGLIRRQDDFPRVVTKRGLPTNLSREVERRVDEIGEDEEGAWRHVTASAVLEFPHWDDAVEVTYVHGPRDHVAWREHDEVCRRSSFESWKRMGFRDWREVSHEEMDVLVKERPELLADPHQGIAKVYALVRTQMTASQRLGFDSVLGWLRELQPTRKTRLLVYFEI